MVLQTSKYNSLTVTLIEPVSVFVPYCTLSFLQLYIALDCHWNHCREMVSRELPVSCKISFSDHVNKFRNEFQDPETIGKYTLTMPWCLNRCFMPFSSEIFNPENDWLPQNGYLQSENEFGYENTSKYYQNSCRNNFTSHYSCDLIIS